MVFKDIWKDKVDNVDDVRAEDINAIANEAIRLETQKVNKVDGMGLSQNSFTDEEKEKLADLTNYDDTELRLRDERLKYYGDPNIVPTDESLFTVGSVGDGTCYIMNCYATGDIVVPYKFMREYGYELVSAIEPFVFFSKDNITSVILPNIALYIGNNNFSDCLNLKSVYIASNAKGLDEAFSLPNHSDFKVICAEGSVADKYAKENGLNVEYTDEVTKQFVLDNGGKVNVITQVADTLILEDNQDAQLGEIASLVLTMPENVEATYYSSFNFKSGEEPTVLSYSSTPVIWCGDDCDSDGAFVPEANTVYEVSIKNLGSNGIVARVGVV